MKTDVTRTYWDYKVVWGGTSPSAWGGILSETFSQSYDVHPMRNYAEALKASVVFLHPGTHGIQELLEHLNASAPSRDQLVLMLSSESYDEATFPNLERASGLMKQRVVFIRDPGLLRGPESERLLGQVTPATPDEELPRAFRLLSFAPRRLISFAILLQGCLDFDSAQPDPVPSEWWSPAALGENETDLRKRLLAEMAAATGQPRSQLEADLRALAGGLSRLPFSETRKASLKASRDSLLGLLRESWLK